ncbi:peptidoglycan DD-metalloendopeptidase family protein [Patescibacteria group bacterium]|nr:peptidoglycan DD-metalloendopeptidase family protein [Patescibacteria group bacterium]
MRFIAPLFLIGTVAAAALFLSPGSSFGDTASSADIQAQITAHNQQITALQQEIAGYQTQITTLGGQKQTLQSSIKSLDLTRQKTAAQLSLTQSQIVAANLQLQRLGSQITTKQQAIDLDRQSLAASLRQIATADNLPIIAAVVSSETLTEAWKDTNTIAQLNEALATNANLLAGDEHALADQQTSVSTTKGQLTGLSTDLTTQKGQIDATTKTKQQLLAQTNSQESSYQKLIAQKKAQEAAFQSELSQLENSLKGVSSSQIPHAGSGILAWPFSDAIMANCVSKQGALGNVNCITQYFGNTAFATANASVYNGLGHNGVDFGVPIGTPVQAALSGTVLATGNTDLVPGCFSFGKWVMIKHSNGLDTLYAHLSQISATQGQAVTNGTVIGYSGMTGYATGPHLHFGVYASAGVQILTLKQFRGATSPCANATMPVSPKNAYLNPLSYL